MDPKLTEQLQQTLAALLANAQDAAAWAKGEIPTLVKEKIMFGRISETASLLIAVFMLYWAVTLCRSCVLRLVNGDYNDEMGWVFGAIAMGIATIVLVSMATVQLDAASKAWFAPRLYIVEWLMAQVHK